MRITELTIFKHGKSSTSWRLGQTLLLAGEAPQGGTGWAAALWRPQEWLALGRVQLLRALEPEGWWAPGQMLATALHSNQSPIRQVHLQP